MTAIITMTSFSASARSEPMRAAIYVHGTGLHSCAATHSVRADMALEHDPRAARWEARLRTPVIAAALAVLPLVALSLTHPHGAWKTVEVTGHWAVWLVFAAEVAVMLSVVKDRRAWIGSHRFELLVVLVSSPLIPLALALAPALRLLIVAKAFKALKVAKAIKLAKLTKSVRRCAEARARGRRARPRAVAIALASLIVLYCHRRSPLKGNARPCRSSRRTARDVRCEPTCALVVAGAGDG